MTIKRKAVSTPNYPYKDVWGNTVRIAAEGFLGIYQFRNYAFGYALWGVLDDFGNLTQHLNFSEISASLSNGAD